MYKYIKLYIISALVIISGIVLVDIIKEEYTSVSNTIEKADEFYEFSRYYTKDFEQAKNGTNCGPTMFCDVVSYYEEKDNKQYIKKTDGRITQKTYDSVCKYINYQDEKGTNVTDLIFGLENFFDGKNGKPKCKIQSMTLNRWDKIKKHVDSNQIMLLIQNDHVYMVGGYIEIEEGKFLDVFTTWREDPFCYIKYTPESVLYKVTIK